MKKTAWLSTLLLACACVAAEQPFERQLAYVLTAQRPVVLAVELMPSQVRVVTMLDLPAAQFTGPDAELLYHYRAVFKDRRGVKLDETTAWVKTRKVLLRDQAGVARENVTYREHATYACEPRMIVLAVPAGAATLELQWPEQAFESASVQGVAQIRTEKDSGALYTRWSQLEPEARERLARANALDASAASLKEKLSAMRHPWLRMVPAGDPGIDYVSRHVFVAATALEYVPPAQRTARAVEALAGAHRAPVYNVVGPGAFEVAWRPVLQATAPPAWLPGSKAVAPQRVTVGIMPEDGVQRTVDVSMSGGPEDRRGFGMLAAGLQTVELLLPPESPGLLSFSTNAAPAKALATAPVGPPGGGAELRPSVTILRAWSTGRREDALNPEVEVVTPPGPGTFSLRIACRSTGRPGEPPPASIALGAVLLDGSGQVIDEVQTEARTDTSPGSYFLPDQGLSAAAPTGEATCVLVLDGDVKRARFWTSEPAWLQFYTRLETPLDVVVAEREADRAHGLLRWQALRFWYSLIPLNAKELEQAGRTCQISAPLRALSRDPVTPAELPPETELAELSPRRPLSPFRMLEQARLPREPGAQWDRWCYQRVPAGGSIAVMRRHPDFPSRPVPMQGRLIYLLPPGASGKWLTAKLDGGVVGSGLTFGIRGELPLGGACGGSGKLRLEGAAREGSYFVNLSPPPGCDASLPWRERTFQLLTPGRVMAVDVDKRGAGPIAMNLHVQPLRGAEDLVLEASLAGPSQKLRVPAGMATEPRWVLRYKSDAPATGYYLDRPGPPLATMQAAPLVIHDDRPPGRYQWSLKVVSGTGALVRTFLVAPPRAGRGTIWARSKI